MKAISYWKAVPIVLAVGLVIGSLKAAHDFSQKATAAQAYARAAADTIDSLETAASRAVSNAVKAETLFVHDTAAIATADSAGHPDSTCNQSIAARDSALQESENEAAYWKRAWDLEARSVSELHRVNDSLTGALAARPKLTLPVIEAFHPALHIAAQAMIYPRPQLGLGLSYDLASLHL